VSGARQAAPDLDVANAVARHTRRGWRIDRAGAAPIDGCVALAMALDRAQHVAKPARLLGWL